MIRARAAYKVSRYAEQGFKGVGGHTQIFSEMEISEDIELGARIHASGFKSVYVPHRLCTGEVRAWRSMPGSQSCSFSMP
jgi:cellulose synthase/poly-beta-1,6-N-acetylglucosamine synthase-like glycosyltransferase